MRKRHLTLLALGVILAPPAVASGGAGTHITVAPNNQLTFSPAQLTVDFGGASDLQWDWFADPTDTEHNVREAHKHRIGSGRWQTWKNDTGAFSGVFGKKDRPVRVRAGKTYSFEVRSERAAKPKKHSDWSPKLVVST